MVMRQGRCCAKKPRRWQTAEVLSSDYTTCAMLRAVDGVVRDGTHRHKVGQFTEASGKPSRDLLAVPPLSLGKQGRILLE
jgi:hypothetical protein